MLNLVPNLHFKSTAETIADNHEYGNKQQGQGKEKAYLAGKCLARCARTYIRPSSSPGVGDVSHDH